ncbi:alpha/beta fold hydrolase [Gilvimarinus sp. DA14]|uniref:alpha/beta fold hydrolase n=1 Tax=Gilvimarinus sp. DA14 TaxID=2956798 RepID=UPI0020B787CD|nr:alpha/beta fold hydrolase [Gilvimarinus sp. DA14]UTF61034.1 alpha/beta hydrolase [Gilvimarinus sp. DA14]
MAARLSPVVGLLLVLGVALVLWQWLAVERSADSAVVTTYGFSEYPCADALRIDLAWRCARLTTPEGFILEVRRLKGDGSDGKAPLIYLQGGPGVDAGFSPKELQSWQSWRDFAGLERDLILMQRRGTSPDSRWRCPQYESLGRKLLAQSLSLQREFELGRATLLQCLETLNGFDPRQFGTWHNRADLAALVRLWDFTEFNLYGASYGSRLAIAAADLPGLNTLVLDAVYPPGVGGVAQWPSVFGDSINRFAAACASDQACRTAWRQYYPQQVLNRDNLLAALSNTLEYLARLPVQVDVSLDGLPQRVAINDQRFIAAFFAASYRRDRWALAVRAMAGAPQRARKDMVPLIERYANQVVSESVNSLVFLAVDCRDNPLGTKQDYQQQVKQLAGLGRYLERGWNDQVCHLWPKADPPAVPNLPERVKVIMINGAFDPITPSHWAEQLQSSWQGSELTVFPATGHVVMGENPCVLAQLEALLSGQRRRLENCR